MEKQKQERLQVSYIPAREDFLAAYRDHRVIKTTGSVAVVESVLLALLAVWFLVSYLRGGQRENLSLSVFCVLMVGVIALVPWAVYRRRAQKEADGEPWQMCFEEESVTLRRGDALFRLPLDRSGGYWRKESQIYLILPNKAYWIVPLHRFEAEIAKQMEEKIKLGFYRIEL